MGVKTAHLQLQHNDNADTFPHLHIPLVQIFFPCRALSYPHTTMKKTGDDLDGYNADPEWRSL
jgi:hypothetical protein